MTDDRPRTAVRPLFGEGRTGTFRTMRAHLATFLVVLLAIPAAGAVADGPEDLRPALPGAPVSLPGVDVACTPTEDHPVPVVLVHGTRADRAMNWPYLGPALADRGLCVYSVDLPDRGQAPIADSVAAVAQRVDEVRAATGAAKVSLFGHSLGGLVARDWVVRGGGAGLVDDVVTMGTPHTGYYTEPPGDMVDTAFNTGCVACVEMARTSAYMQALNVGDLTPGTVSYTSITTIHDQIALPLDSQHLPEDDASVANVILQDACPDNSSDHLTMALDPLVRDWVLDALLQHGPADRSRSVDCAPHP